MKVLGGVGGDTRELKIWRQDVGGIEGKTWECMARRDLSVFSFGIYSFQLYFPTNLSVFTV